MASLEEGRWYIEAWDASAGRAFISHRPIESQSEPETYFVSPPYFGPQQIASRAIGYAATRGAFQFGFFIGDVEQKFDSIEEIIELVRRIYSSRGMWPGPGGAIPPPLPRTPDGPSDIFEEPLGPAPLQSDLFAKFKALVETLDRPDETQSTSYRIDWNFELEWEDEGAKEILGYAANALMRELLKRASNDYTESPTEWNVALSYLTHLISRLGVWHTISEGLLSFVSKKLSWYDLRIDAPPAQIGLYDMLERIPLPSEISREFALGQDHDTSLLSLLSGSLSYGLARSKNSKLEISLLIFAGACVVTQKPYVYYGRSARIAHDALNWLETQLPQFKFSPSIEATIRDVPKDWYTFEQTYRGNSPPNPGGSSPPDTGPYPPGPSTDHTTGPNRPSSVSSAYNAEIDEDEVEENEQEQEYRGLSF